VSYRAMVDDDQLPSTLDRGDLDRAYRRYAGLVIRRARRILGDEQLARDVCQDVFVQLVRAGNGWTAPSAVGWLYRTTTNCCLNLMRGTRRWRDFLRRLPPPQPIKPALSTQLLLQGVPVRLHEIAIYYGLDGMSQEEIALVLGVSQKTVSNRISELRSWLVDADTERLARNNK
jgi:DNA-directed RNA polymerase specialized sigma24 family protein